MTETHQTEVHQRSNSYIAMLLLSYHVNLTCNAAMSIARGTAYCEPLWPKMDTLVVAASGPTGRQEGWFGHKCLNLFV